MMNRTFLIPFALVLAAVSGLHCAAAQEQTAGTGGDAQQGQGPRLSLEPTAGPAGGAVAAKGSGFRDDCGVRLYLDTESEAPLATADVDEFEAFSARLTIPAQTAAGEHVVLARGLRLGTEGCAAPTDDLARAAFTVTPGGTKTPPSLVIRTREARPGTTVRVEGRGFCGEAACSAVTILIDGQVGAGNVKVSSAGTFNAEARVPAITIAGRIAVTALQTLADHSEIRAFGELQITPRPPGQREPVE
jgi:hypothetical protein